MTVNSYPSNPYTVTNSDRLHAFKWKGGKYNHLTWLFPLLPECHHYVEPFGGSAAVLLNRKPSPIETYNDLNGDAVNFFTVLREQSDDLIKALALTPWAREEFEKAINSCGEISTLEKARRFYIAVVQGFMSNSKKLSRGDWTHHITSYSPSLCWFKKLTKLPMVAERLLNVQFENNPALKVITMYDTPKTLFYVDPPYLMETRTAGKAYAHEMTLDDHRALAEKLNACVGKVALSGYDHPLMREMFPPDKWFLSKEREKTVHGGGKRTECLWTNYDPAAISGKKGLFV